MGFDDNPTIKRLREQAHGLGLILALNRGLRKIGLGSEKIAELQEKYDECQARLEELTDYPARFNRYFASDGWLAHGFMEFALIKRAVDEYEANGRDAATAVLLEHYSATKVRERLFFFNGIEELAVRRRLIDLALEDYEAERFHAAIPVLLMVIDGAVNDAVGQGFHSRALDLDAWDCLTTADGEIAQIKAIFQKSRRKTRTDPIHLPYRHGILHGA